MLNKKYKENTSLICILLYFKLTREIFTYVFTTLSRYSRMMLLKISTRAKVFFWKHPTLIKIPLYGIARNSAIGPSASTGKNVRTPTINIVPSKIPPNNRSSV